MSLKSIPHMSQRAYESLDQEDPLSGRTKADYSHDEKDVPYWPRFQNDGSLTSRTEKYRARLGSFARVANTVLLVVIAGLLAALLWRDGRSRASLQVGGDFGGAGPQCTSSCLPPFFFCLFVSSVAFVASVTVAMLACR